MEAVAGSPLGSRPAVTLVLKEPRGGLRGSLPVVATWGDAAGMCETRRGHVGDTWL